MQLEKRVTLAASQDQIDAWKEAAHLRRVNMSEWMRKVLDANAQKTRETQ